MNTLYMDTHNKSIDIILCKDGKIVVKKEKESNFDHSKSTIPLLMKALEEVHMDVKELNEIIIINGPGSFTGVRIGVTIAKTLAYTLQIPIKTMSSLLVKAVSFTHDTIHIVEREKNGVFLGTFNKENELIGEYQYLSNSEYEKIDKENHVENVKIDYEKIMAYSKQIKPINPHAVNPLYIKRIEVQK